jgi:hypothetical protein
VDLRGIGDEGEDPHLGTTAGTAQGVNFVDLCEQPCPRRLPAFGSQAEQMGHSVPCIARSRGIQPVAANQPGPRIRIC